MDFEVRRIQGSERRWAEARPILSGIGLVLLAAGFFLLVNGLYAWLQKYRRIGQWVPVEAEVLDFKVVNEESGRVNNGYRAHFTFQYEVQDRKLVGRTQSDHKGFYSSELSDWIQYLAAINRSATIQRNLKKSQLTISTPGHFASH